VQRKDSNSLGQEKSKENTLLKDTFLPKNPLNVREILLELD
jgi:hypothetical protein